MTADPMIMITATMHGAKELKMHVHEGWVSEEYPDTVVWSRGPEKTPMPVGATPITHIIFGFARDGVVFPGHHRPIERWGKRPNDKELELLKTLAAQSMVEVEIRDHVSKKMRRENDALLRMLDRGRAAVLCHVSVN